MDHTLSWLVCQELQGLLSDKLLDRIARDVHITLYQYNDHALQVSVPQQRQ